MTKAVFNSERVLETKKRLEDEVRASLQDRYGIETELAGNSLFRVFGVSLGLGDLFDDVIEAEVDWLERTKIVGWSGLEIMTKGTEVRVKRLCDRLDKARGIY